MAAFRLFRAAHRSGADSCEFSVPRRTTHPKRKRSSARPSVTEHRLGGDQNITALNRVKPPSSGSDDRLGEANRNPRVSEHLAARRSADTSRVVRRFCRNILERSKSANPTELPVTRSIASSPCAGNYSSNVSDSDRVRVGFDVCWEFVDLALGVLDQAAAGSEAGPRRAGSPIPALVSCVSRSGLAPHRMGWPSCGH